MSIISLKKVSPTDQAQWDGFVDRSFNGTLFHKIRFLDYHIDRKPDLTLLGFFSHNELVGILPCVIENGALKSPVGASFGGIALPELPLSKVFDIVKALLQWCRNHDIRDIYFTHAPIIYNHILSQDLEFMLRYCGFSNFMNAFSSVLDLSCINAHDPLMSCSSSGRRAIRKSIKSGVEVRQSDDFVGYYPMLAKNKARHDTHPAHSLDELLKLKKLFPNDIGLFGAYVGKKLVAGITTFRVTPRVLLTFYIASDPKYQELRPVNHILFTVTQRALQQGYSFLDLGVSMNTKSDNPIDPAWSLVSFKEHSGSRGFLRPSFHLRLI